MLKNDAEVRRKLGARIRDLRRRHRLSQAELAARVGLSGKFIGQVERGGNTSVTVMLSIADALDIHPKQLFDDAPIAAEASRLGVRVQDAERAERAIKTLAQIFQLQVRSRRR